MAVSSASSPWTPLQRGLDREEGGTVVGLRPEADNNCALEEVGAALAPPRPAPPIQCLAEDHGHPPL